MKWLWSVLGLLLALAAYDAGRTVQLMTDIRRAGEWQLRDMEMIERMMLARDLDNQEWCGRWFK